MAKNIAKKKPVRPVAEAVKKSGQPKVGAKKKATPTLTAEKLRQIADKHQPPQSWFDEDLDGI